MIAQRILDCAATGERDPVELEIAGVDGLYDRRQDTGWRDNMMRPRI